MDSDNITIIPPSDKVPYPSIKLKPEYKASLETQWSKAIILKSLGKRISYSVIQNKLINLWKPGGTFINGTWE